MEKDLKQVEHQTMLHFFNDGLWDVLLGLFLLCWGVALLTSAWLGVVFVAAVYGIWMLKRRVTYPRSGHIKLGISEAGFIWVRIMVAAVIVVVVLFTAVMVLLGDGRPPLLPEYFPLIIGAVIAFNVTVIAGWLAVKRFFCHAAVIFLAVAVCWWLGIGWEWGFIIAGSITGIWGLGILLVFLRRCAGAPDGEVNRYAG